MKILKFSALALLLALFSFSSVAANTDEPSPLHLKCRVMTEQKVRVQLFNLEQKPTHIAITDYGGEVIYKDYVRQHNGYARAYNFKGIPDGKYILTADQDGAKVSTVIRLKGRTVMVSDPVKH